MIFYQRVRFENNLEAALWIASRHAPEGSLVAQAALECFTKRIEMDREEIAREAIRFLCQQYGIVGPCRHNDPDDND